SEQEHEQLARAAARVGVSLLTCTSIPNAIARLRHGKGTLGVIVAPQIELAKLVDAVREEAELFTMPIVAYVQRPSADGFRDAYLAGADDVLIASDPGGLTRRLANLETRSKETRPEVTQGVAVVVSLHEGARRRLGRALRQAGFDVSYAASVDEVAALAARGEAPLLAVATGEPASAMVVNPDDTGVVRRVGDVPVLFLGWDEQKGIQHSSEQIVDATGRLLFFADERTKAARFKDRRASRRELFASVCSFREAGSVLPTFAITYNISREGIYVRTLDPPRPQSMVWVELQAPSSGVPVHLRAQVVWQRLPSGLGIMPPGCGLRIDAAACPPADLEHFLKGYELLIS
ncbi:MAG TPA: PilZ domain-containing protein, partial [Polyangiales bacterium]|nr:PilZ domain-containing protein [Polyangiales bacterium]